MQLSAILSMEQFGAAYVKETAMLHNIFNFHEFANVWTVAADVKFFLLPGQMFYEGELRFMTLLACGYPRQF